MAFQLSGYKIVVLGFLFLGTSQMMGQESEPVTESRAAAPAARADSASFFWISAIKTVSGIRPDDEFFDIYLKWQWSDHWFTVGSFDIALTTSDADSLGSSSEEFAEGGFFLNRVLMTSKDKRRQGFVGLGMKHFDTISYFGMQVGAIELGSSSFNGSYITGGLFRRLYAIDSAENADLLVKEHRWNLYFEFGVHSESVPVLDALRIKAGVLMPVPGLNNNPKPVAGDLKTRIVIEVPLKHIRF